MNIAPNHIWFEDRLRGTTTSISATTVAPYIWSDSTAAENGSTYSGNWYDSNTGITNTQMRATYGGAGSFVEWCFRRAPGFMDIVCYTGTGSATTFAHNLGVAPELIIVKKRSAVATTGWPVGATVLGWANKMYLNSTNGSAADSTMWNSTAPTASVFSVGTNTDCNASGATFVAYLFASIPGVIKIGTYAGTGATQTIDCGFPSGARFVMIHRTDNNIGNWFVWDTARGMVSGTDPRLTWDSTTAEANSNYVYTISTGFQIVTTTSAVNASSGTYFYMAIA
jgi:hypothetical protein